MILRSLTISRAELRRETGWELEPEGACKGDACVPLSGTYGDPVDIRALASELRMALVYEPTAMLWALGPETLGGTLTSALAPALRLSDRAGRSVKLESLQGRKVLLVAWASW